MKRSQVIALLLTFSVGCSFSLRGPSSKDPRTDPQCSSTSARPAIDGIAAVLLALLSVDLLVSVPSCPDSDTDDACSRQARDMAHAIFSAGQ